MSKVQQRDLGDRAERLVENLIETSGWLQLGTRKFTNDYGDEVAPMLEGDERMRIMPDFYVCRNGRSVWIEVKAKSDGAVWITKNNRYEHGIDKPNWEHYRKVSDATGAEVWLFIYELDTGLLLQESVERLDVVGDYIKDTYGPNTKYDGPMVFFRKKDFKPLNLTREHVPDEFFGQESLPVETSSNLNDFSLFYDQDRNQQSGSDESQLVLDEF